MSESSRWRGATGARSAATVLLAMTVLLSAAASTPASWLSRTPAADREEAAPLRELDLADVLAGERPLPDGLAAALEELPSRCSAGDVFERESCDDALRCGWLVARARLARVWTQGEQGPRRAAVKRLERAARRLAVGGRCGEDAQHRERWAADRAEAARDAATVAIATWVAAARGAPPGAVEWPASEAARRELRRALSRGLGAARPERLVVHRQEVVAARERTRWLSRQKAVAALRHLVSEAWEPVGGVPRGCGRGLWDERLLEDGWRGVLVRKAVPEALRCIVERLPGELERRGAPMGDRPRARSIGKSLMRRAAADAGGREFPESQAVLRELASLRKAIRPAGRDAERAAGEAGTDTPVRRSAAGRDTDAKQASRARPVHRAQAKAAAPPAPDAGSAGGRDEPEGDASRQSRDSRTGAPKPVRRQTAEPDRRLIRLARRIEELGLAGEGGSPVVQARAARDEQRRRSVLQELIVIAHRAVCAPLERLAAEDLEAARRVLGSVGRAPDEQVCRGVDGRRALRELLDEALPLRRLAAAAAVRGAARALASERLEAAERRLAAVPEDWRGTTWRLVRAWAHRLARDPVSASEVLATIDESTLDRLRASGDEAVARLVAHATVARSP